MIVDPGGQALRRCSEEETWGNRQRRLCGIHDLCDGAIRRGRRLSSQSKVRESKRLYCGGEGRGSGHRFGRVEWWIGCTL